MVCVCHNKEMEIILGSLIIFAISQTAKFLIRVVRGEKISFQSILWAYVWASGYPSSHSALLAGLTYFVWVKEGLGTLFAITIVVTAVILYNLIDNKKQQDLLKKFHQKGGSYKRLIDMSGHNIGEVFVGIAFGVLLAHVLSPFLF